MELCHGICSVAEMSRIESGGKEPDHFLMECLLERMGKPVAQLECVLTREAYLFYELRYQIQNALRKSQVGQVLELLEVYQMQKNSGRPLHRQFCSYVRAICLLKNGESKVTVQEALKDAVEVIIPEEGEESLWKYALSVKELQILSFLWRVKPEVSLRSDMGFLNKLLNYIEYRCGNTSEKVSIYPYVVKLMADAPFSVEACKILKPYCEEALRLLKFEGIVVWLPQILESPIFIYKTGDSEYEHKQCMELEEQLKALLEVVKEYGADFSDCTGHQVLGREYSLDNEVIRKKRLAYKISQEELCEDICTQETLSRIESGRRSPTIKNFEKLAKRIRINQERTSTTVIANDFEILELQDRVERELFLFHHEKGAELLEKLEKLLEMSVPENKQYILSRKGILMWMEQKTSLEEVLKLFRQAFEYTFEDWERLDVSSVFLTRSEVSILNQAAIIYREMDQREKATEIYEKVLKNYRKNRKSRVSEQFHLLEYVTILGNLATLKEEMDCFEEAIELSRQKIKLLLYSGKGGDIGRSLVTIGFTLERQGDKSCMNYYRKALSLMKLMDEEYRYGILAKYLKKMTIIM